MRLVTFSNSSIDISIALLVAPQAGNTVSKFFSDSSRYTSTPSFNAKGHTPPTGWPIFYSTSVAATI